MAIQVQTTQNVTLNLKDAGLGPRILARIVDYILITIWIIIWSFLYVSGSTTTESSIILLLLWVPPIFYDLVFESLNRGQTPGKMLLRIRVVNIDGTTPSIGSYLIRWLFQLVDITFTGGSLAVIMIAFSKKSQRLGDILAGTTVISLKEERNIHINLPDFQFQENYKVAYNSVLETLNDRDIDTIQLILNDYKYYNDLNTLRELANKVKLAGGYTFEGSDRIFLQQIVSDYNYLSTQ